jgi:hypothetical protein
VSRERRTPRDIDLGPSFFVRGPGRGFLDRGFLDRGFLDRGGLVQAGSG